MADDFFVESLVSKRALSDPLLPYYKTISADVLLHLHFYGTKLSLTSDEWLKKSYKLRLRHEAAHYETLRILGGMKNHALDEILADLMHLDK